MSERPRSFAWIAGLAGPTPQIIFEDPRTGCAGVSILETYPIPPDDQDTLDQLALRFPPLTPPSQG